MSFLYCNISDNISSTVSLKNYCNVLSVHKGAETKSVRFHFKGNTYFQVVNVCFKEFFSFYYKHSTAILCNVFVSFFLWQTIVSIEKNIVTEISVLLYISLLVTHIYHISTAKPHVLLNNMEKVRQLKARLQIMVYICEREKIARRLHY